MESLLRRWKLLALKYKREATAIHEKITEIILAMPKEEIKKLNLGEIELFKLFIYWFRLDFNKI